MRLGKWAPAGVGGSDNLPASARRMADYSGRFPVGVAGGGAFS